MEWFTDAPLIGITTGSNVEFSIYANQIFARMDEQLATAARAIPCQGHRLLG